MLLNKFLFPAPKPPHYTVESHQETLFWLPGDPPIPCMFYKPTYSNKKIEYFMIFCHGNGCDIGSMQYTLDQFCRNLNMYIISFEYPSYGLCTATSPGRETINDHADKAFRFVRNTLHWPEERIIIYGHSIGSGSGCHLASTHPVGALILQSPYTSIRNLIREKAGFLSYVIPGRSWDNLEAIKNIKCPILFIHGQADTLIPPSHSQALHDACEHITEKKLVILPNEDHNSMSETTLIKFIKKFMNNLYQRIDLNLPLPEVHIDPELRKPPSPSQTDVSATTNSSNGILSSLPSMSRASTAATMSVIQKIYKKQPNESNEDNE